MLTFTSFELWAMSISWGVVIILAAFEYMRKRF